MQRRYYQGYIDSHCPCTDVGKALDCLLFMDVSYLHVCSVRQSNIRILLFEVSNNAMILHRRRVQL